MKVSLNWLRQYLDINIGPEEIGQVLTGTGLEVEGMEKVESIPGGLAGMVVGYVLECNKHPGAQRGGRPTRDRRNRWCYAVSDERRTV
jgi:phenylalanyl-tRNA synthetase beta chain